MSGSPKSKSRSGAGQTKLYARIQSLNGKDEANVPVAKEKQIVQSSAEQVYARIHLPREIAKKSQVPSAQRLSKGVKGKRRIDRSQDSETPGSNCERNLVLSDFSKRTREHSKKSQAKTRRQLQLDGKDEDDQGKSTAKKKCSSHISLSSDSEPQGESSAFSKEDIAMELSPVRSFFPSGRKIPKASAGESPLGQVQHFVLSPKSYQPGSLMRLPAQFDTPLSPVENLRRRIDFTESVAVTDDEATSPLLIHGPNRPMNKDDTMKGAKIKRVNLRTRMTPIPGVIDEAFKAESLETSTIAELKRVVCCRRNCLKLTSTQAVYNYRQDYFRHESKLRNVVLSWGLPIQGRYYSLPGGRLVCRTAFKKIYRVGNNRLRRLRERSHADVISDRRGGRQTTAGGLVLQEWMDTFFRGHCERLPNQPTYHLPDNFTKHEVYEYYKTSLDSSDPASLLAFSSFTKVWRKEFPNVKIPRRNRFAVCELCTELKARRDNAVLAEKKALASRALMIHREQQMQERVKLSKHRRKCLVSSSKYLGIVIDGMDQKKTAIPHWPSPPKNVDKDSQIKVHVVGALLFNETVQSRAFLMFGNIKADANLTVSVIQKIICEWEGALPEVLYLQLDNTTRENKNGVLLGYLNLLVQQGIFRKVKIGFLLVGHTHDQIDQMFSRFSVRLRREKCFTLPSLVETIEAAYKPKPKVIMLKETWDFTEWFRSPTKLLESLHGITFNQQFRIKMIEEKAKMWAKQFSTDEFWLPSEGVTHLKAMPESDRRILSSEQHPLKAYCEMKKSSLEGRDLDPVKSVESIHLNLRTNCYKYFSALDIEWWESFFLEQLDLGNYIKSGTRAPLMEQLEFPRARPTSSSPLATEPDEAEASRPVEVEDIREEVLGNRRMIYTGTHRPEPGTIAHAKKYHLGDLSELQVNSLIAVVCEEDELERPFWIAKVINIQSFIEKDNKKIPKEVYVQWFATESSDAYTGRYFPSVEKIIGKGRGRRLLHKQMLNLTDVSVLAFGFELTQRSILRVTTVKVIKENLFSFERTKMLPPIEEENRRLSEEENSHSDDCQVSQDNVSETSSWLRLD
ncbi:hypothetical protein R1sor_019130 [Riccia sorocarpa]|uniref:DUF7869 domain-containing protein n=1 Tax=Riccia sorocarpa TaxID=122646 RepID=A0ABD3IBM6_9MARC